MPDILRLSVFSACEIGNNLAVLFFPIQLSVFQDNPEPFLFVFQYLVYKLQLLHFSFHGVTGVCIYFLGHDAVTGGNDSNIAIVQTDYLGNVSVYRLIS